MDGPTTMARFECDRMTGMVLVRDEKAFRQVHVLALRFIEKDGTVSGLLGSFGLGEQVMQEVLADLVFDDAVRIDLEADRAAVAEPYASLLRQDDIEEIQQRLTRTVEIKVTWLRDRASGEVFVERDVSRYTRAPARQTIWKTPRGAFADSGDLREMSHALLARAASTTLAEQLGSNDFDIVRVEQIEKKRKLKAETLFIPLRQVAADTGEEIWVPDCPGIPPHVREAWASLINEGKSVITGVNETESTDPLVSPQLVQASISTSLARVSELLDEDIGSASVSNAIEQEFAKLKSLTATADEMERSTGTHQLVVGRQDAHEREALQLASLARESLVVCSAFTSETGLVEFAKRALDHLPATASLALVQGLDGSLDATDTHQFGDARGRFHSWLKQLSEPDQIRVHLGRTRVPTHSKFVIADGEAALVTSCNLLTGSSDGALEVGIKTDAVLALQNLLDHAIEVLPSDTLQLHRIPDTRRKLRGRERRKIWFKKKYEPAKNAWNAFFANSTQERRQDLDAALQELAQVASRTDELRPATVLCDAEHRSAMFRMLNHASSSLVVSSDRALPVAMGARLANAVKTAVERNVHVAMLWGRATDKSSRETKDSARTVREFLAQLGEASASASIPAEPVGNHSKVVVQDDAAALVSSFNFLSFGANEAHPGARELGLMVHDPGVAGSLAAELRQYLANRDQKASVRVQGIAPAATDERPARRTFVVGD